MDKHVESWKDGVRTKALPVLPIDRTFMQQSTFYRSPVQNTERTCMGQAVTAVRELFSPQFPFLQKGQINEECVLGNVKN